MKFCQFVKTKQKKSIVKC